MEAPVLGATWLQAGAEPHPTGSITHCTVLRYGQFSSVSLRSGDICAEAEPATGVYWKDTRILSHHSFSINNLAPILLDHHEVQNSLTSVFTNPAFGGPDGQQVAQQSLVVRRRRVIERTVFESLSVSNYANQPVNCRLRIEFGADFRDIFEVRGYHRAGPQAPVSASADSDAATFRYPGTDGRTRMVLLRFTTHPDQMSIDAATFELHLGPRESASVELELAASEDERPAVQRISTLEADFRVRKAQAEWLTDMTALATDNELLNGVVRRSLLDIDSLRTTVEGHRFIAAGVPWFDTLFGRDSLITGIELAAFTTEPLRDALLVLAAYQADARDDARDALPGKIPHELRWGELAQSGEVPFSRYYGSVDVTPLYLVAADEYLAWTDDIETIASLWPVIRRAADFCREQRQSGVKSFLSYARVSVDGLEHQGWKDSRDAIVWPDGSAVGGPIALVEVQGYLAAAFRAFSRMASRVAPKDADRFGAETATLCAETDREFGHPDLGYVLCLDGNGRSVPTPASNVGQHLWSGSARPDLAGIAARRLMEPDLFSGWGIRTLGTGVAGFNPLGYHLGSVWPHDNALAVAGFRRYGQDGPALAVADALIEAAISFHDARVPELFSGESRELRPVPTPYPVSSRPQAWAAASIPYVITSLLGIRPYGAEQLSITRPALPSRIASLTVTGLRLGRGSVDLSFQRRDAGVAVEVHGLQGGLKVVLRDD